MSPFPSSNALRDRIPLGIGLAPMEGVTSFAMRVWFYLVSAPDSMGTPFLRVTDTFPLKALPVAYAPELTTLADVTPYRLTPQLMATETSDFIRTARYFPEHVPFVELNCGCPSPTCVGKGAGSSLLKDPDDFAEMVGELALVLGPERLAIKMRTGYQSADEFPELLRVLSGIPLAQLTVHGRSRPDRYRGRSRWDLVQSAATATGVPVIASGDIVDLASFKALTETAPGIQGALIGRGALRNPWIFSEIRRGQPTVISRETLIHAIGTYVLLHELDVTDPTRLHTFAQEIFTAAPCGTSEVRWINTFALLAKTLTEGGTHSLGPEGEWPSIELKRNTLGRAKMLWNYLRSSLPEQMFAPQILRAKNLTDLLVSIYRTAGTEGDKGMPLVYRSDIDWLFAGGRDPTVKDSELSDSQSRTLPEEACSIDSDS